MVTKKKVIEKEPEKPKQIIKYTPVFEEIKYEKLKKIDLNWYALGRRSKTFVRGLLKPRVEYKNNIPISKPKKWYFDYKKLYEIFSLLWNHYVNKIGAYENISERIKEIKKYGE